MKIWHISDTHGFHNQLNIPDNIDMVIHSGDCSNYKEPYRNEQEVRDFLTWYNKLPIKHKIYVAGNHDTSIDHGYITKDNFGFNITYLEHESIEIENIKIFGSPYTPSFGDWSFMKPFHKIAQVWESIPEDIDILVTHGPPKGILDLTESRDGYLEYCGDKSLLNRIYKIEPKYHLFGHIHNCSSVINTGTRTLDDLDTVFMNSTCVFDGRFDKGITSNGQIFNIK